MAILEPTPGRMRDSVRVDRRPAQEDGYGNSDGDWQPLIARRQACLEPTRGGEAVIAARLQGVSSWDLWLRHDSETRQIRPGDRVVDRHDETRAFAVRFAQDMTGRRRWILLQLELGVAV